MGDFAIPVAAALTFLVILLALLLASMTWVTDKPRLTLTVPDTVVKVTLACTSDEVQRSENLSNGQIRYSCEDR
jgi:hypothetical protein